MVLCRSWSHPYRNISSDDRIKGFKAISKRIVSKDKATEHKEIKVLWNFDIDIEYDDPDDAIGDMCSWSRRVAEDWDGQEYDAYYEAQQTWKMQAWKQHRIMKVLVLAKGEEPEETDSETSRMGYSGGDDDMDEVKRKGLNVGAGGQVGKDETSLVDEMVCDLGMKCWKHRMVGGGGKKISMPVVTTDHNLVKTMEF
jgi:hypothetical protein